MLLLLVVVMLLLLLFLLCLSMFCFLSCTQGSCNRYDAFLHRRHMETSWTNSFFWRCCCVWQYSITFAVNVFIFNSYFIQFSTIMAKLPKYMSMLTENLQLLWYVKRTEVSIKYNRFGWSCAKCKTCWLQVLSH